MLFTFIFSSPSPRPSPARGEGVLVALLESKVISKSSPDFYPQVPVLHADEVQFPLSPGGRGLGRGGAAITSGQVETRTVLAGSVICALEECAPGRWRTTRRNGSPRRARPRRRRVPGKAPQTASSTTR